MQLRLLVEQALQVGARRDQSGAGAGGGGGRLTQTQSPAQAATLYPLSLVDAVAELCELSFLLMSKSQAPEDPRPRWVELYAHPGFQHVLQVRAPWLPARTTLLQVCAHAHTHHVLGSTHSAPTGTMCLNAMDYGTMCCHATEPVL